MTESNSKKKKDNSKSKSISYNNRELIKHN